MPRQLLNRKAPIGKMNAVAPIAKGGTGASSSFGAVQNLGGIPTSQIGQAGGLLKADSRGYLPISVLREAGFVVGYAVEGPTHLVHNQTSVFRLTNYNSLNPITVSSDVGEVVLVGKEIHVTAPETGSQMTIMIGERELVMQVVPFGPLAPEIVYPSNQTEIRNKTTVYAKPFQSLPDLYSEWETITETTGVLVSIPDGVVAIEVEGRRGVSGAAYVELGTKTYQFGVATTNRRLERITESSIKFWINGSGKLRYRWVYPASRHVATDWEIANDADFTVVLRRSTYDMVNLTAWEVDLPPGEYFIRTRFHGAVD